jgi:hypothetical protein
MPAGEPHPEIRNVAIATAGAVPMTLRARATFISTSPGWLPRSLFPASRPCGRERVAGRDVQQGGESQGPVVVLKALTGRRRPSAEFHYFSEKSVSCDLEKRKRRHCFIEIVIRLPAIPHKID